MVKAWIHALIACALGVALGLLWDSGAARAANLDEDVPGGWRDRARLCQQLTRPDKEMLDGEAIDGWDTVCWLRHAPDALAIEMASQVATSGSAGGTEMRRIVLAALLAAVALPAWADTAANQAAAIALCRRLGGEINVCWMKNVPWADEIAKATLDRCDKLETVSPRGWKPLELWLSRNIGDRSEEFRQCAAERAYIKQRWGY